MKLALNIFAICLLAFSGLGSAGSARVKHDLRHCPPGEIWGGHQCEIQELCTSGYPPDARDICTHPVVRVTGVPAGPASGGPKSPAKSRHACEDGVVFYPHGTLPTDGVNRTLIVSNGSVSELLAEYIAEMKRHDLTIDYKTFNVYFLEQGKANHTRLREGDGVEAFGFWTVLSSTPRKKLWLDAAEKYKAQAVDRRQIDEDVERFRADALCGR